MNNLHDLVIFPCGNSVLEEIRIFSQLNFVTQMLNKTLKLRVSVHRELSCAPNADSWLFQRVFSLSDEALKFIKGVMDGGGVKRMIFEMDDLVWDIPDYNSGRTEMISKERAAEVLSCFNVIVCSTDYLAEKVREIAPHAEIYVNRNRVPTWLSIGVRRKGTTQVIGFSGGNSHWSGDDQGDFSDEWVKALDILTRRGNKLVFFGGEIPKFLSDMPNVHSEPVYPLQLHYKRLIDFALTTYISPLRDNEFNRCKSDIRSIEAAALGANFVGTTLQGGDYGKSGWCVGPNADRNAIEYNIHKAPHKNMKNAGSRYIEHVDTVHSWQKILGFEF